MNLKNTSGRVFKIIIVLIFSSVIHNYLAWHSIGKLSNANTHNLFFNKNVNV